MRILFILSGFLLYHPHTFAQQWKTLGPTELPDLLNAGDFNSKVANGLGRVTCLRFHPGNDAVSKKKIYAGTPFGACWLSNDAGRTWQAMNASNIPAHGVSDFVIDPRNPANQYIATGDPDGLLDPNGPALGSETAQSRGIYRSIDGGKTWTDKPIGRWMTESGTEDKNFWTFPSLKILRKLIHFPDRPVMMTVIYSYNYQSKAFDGCIYRSNDDGENWRPVNCARDAAFKDLEFYPGHPDTMYAGGRAAYKSVDAGLHWESIQQNGLPVDSESERCELAVCSAVPNAVYALIINKRTRQNEIYQSLDAGRKFLRMASAPRSPEWRTALIADPEHPGLLFHTSTNKVSRLEYVDGIWRSSFAGGFLHDDVHELTIDPRTQTLFASTDGGLFASLDSGRSWSFSSRGLNCAESWGISVSQSGPLKILSGMQDCGTMIYQPDSTGKMKWNIIRGGDGMDCAIDPRHPEILYANDGNSNLMFRSDNSGITWGRNLAITGKPAEYLRPIILDPLRDSVIYAGYHDLFRSRDRGQTWKQISDFKNFTDVHRIGSIAIAPSDSQTIYIAYASTAWNDTVREKVFRTSDGGNHWDDITTGLTEVGWHAISSLAVDPSDPKKIYIGFHCGANHKIMRSVTGGKAWEYFDSGIPSDADVYSMIADPVTHSVYAGTLSGVYRISPVQTRWEKFGTGLPDTWIRDLEIRFDTRKLYAATHGYGIWETSLDH